MYRNKWFSALDSIMIVLERQLDYDLTRGQQIPVHLYTG